MCKPCKKEYNARYYIATKERYDDCRAEARKRAQEKRQEKVVEYLSDKRCADCDEGDIRVLEFDHLRDKEFTIGGFKKSWDLIEAEIAKCDVVCANCHRKRTAERSNNYRHRAAMRV